MKSTALLILAAISIAFIGIFIFLEPKNESSSSARVISDSGSQQITLSYKEQNYYPNTIKVKANQPVIITLDSSVKGCFRSLTIKDLGVNEYSPTPKDKISFIPTKKGTFSFACAMGMGYGKIVVE